MRAGGRGHGSVVEHWWLKLGALGLFCGDTWLSAFFILPLGIKHVFMKWPFDHSFLSADWCKQPGGWVWPHHTGIPAPVCVVDRSTVRASFILVSPPMRAWGQGIASASFLGSFSPPMRAWEQGIASA